LSGTIHVKINRDLYRTQNTEGELQAARRVAAADVW